MAQKPRQREQPKWPLTNQAWEDKVRVWERMALGEKDTKIKEWLQLNPPALDRDTIKKLRDELFLAPERVLPDLPVIVRKYRDTLLEEKRAQDSRGNAQSSVEKGDLPANEVTAQGSPNAEPKLENAESFRKRFAEIQDAYSGALDRQMREALNIQSPSRPQQSPDPLTLNVVSHNLSTSSDRFGDYHLDLTPTVEVTASSTIRVTTCVLIMGGGPISEYRGMPNKGKLLGKTTWLPSFRVPEWIQPGTYTVYMGACFAQTLEPSPFLVPIKRLGVGGEEDKYVKSNEFEVTIPELLPPDAAKLAAWKAANPPQHFASGVIG